MRQPLEKVLDQLVNLDTNLIELTDSGYHTLTPMRVKLLQEIKESYNLKYSIHAPWADTNLSADDYLIRKCILLRIMTSIKFAYDLDAQVLSIHPGWHTATEQFTKGKAWELNVRSIHKLLKYADSLDVELLIENVPITLPYLLVSISDFKMFYNELKYEIGMTLDIAHSNLQNETIEFITTFSEKIKHIHVSDNFGSSDEHLPIGKGTIEWKEIARTLMSIGYAGWVTIESYNDIQKSIEYLRQIF
jgi:sugar phosphate isomerase/epimerase